MPVRTTQLGAATRTVVPSELLYTTPAGKRTIVKSFMITNAGLPPGGVSLVVRKPGPPAQDFTLFFQQVLGTNEVVYGKRWVVLNAGDTVRMTGVVGVTHLLSGTELQLP